MRFALSRHLRVVIYWIVIPSEARYPGLGLGGATSVATAKPRSLASLEDDKCIGIGMTSGLRDWLVLFSVRPARWLQRMIDDVGDEARGDQDHAEGE